MHHGSTIENRNYVPGISEWNLYLFTYMWQKKIIYKGCIVYEQYLINYFYFYLLQKRIYFENINKLQMGIN